MNETAESPKAISTVAEFLDWENQQQSRHEWLDGRIVAMTGGTIRHVKLIARLVRGLGNHLDGTPCLVLASDAKVQAALNVFYPDVVVSCAEQDDQEVICKEPKLVIEVLSSSTATHDRTKKRLAYQQIESLEEYLLIAQEVQHVTLYRRAEGWQPLDIISGTLDIRSVGWTLDLADLYQGCF
ncbi:MAG: Uma2 family endonuclease [Synechococcaceae cyanobacterium SM1_2_3]|nr:Uma2 family endonuclease [Synechococcaceae cyanobacterium SM1_2_3]